LVAGNTNPIKLEMFDIGHAFNPGVIKTARLLNPSFKDGFSKGHASKPDQNSGSADKEQDHLGAAAKLGSRLGCSGHRK
jgi:hypothetical protein